MAMCLDKRKPHHNVRGRSTSAQNASVHKPHDGCRGREAARTRASWRLDAVHKPKQWPATLVSSWWAQFLLLLGKRRWASSCHWACICAVRWHISRDCLHANCDCHFLAWTDLAQLLFLGFCRWEEPCRECRWVWCYPGSCISTWTLKELTLQWHWIHVQQLGWTMA